MKIHRFLSPARPGPHPARTRLAGFSLAELMVVIVIIGLLATMVVTQAPKFLSSAYLTRVKSDIQTIDTALQSYAIQHGMKYPDSLEVLVTPDDQGEKWIDHDKIPLDPWKQEYVYEPPYGGQPYRIYTLGADGQPGGEGKDRDIDQAMIKNGDV